MRFSLQLHASLPLPMYERLPATAERYGFVDVTVHDLVLRRPVWPLLHRVARATGRVRLGPNVTHPVLQHPAMIASNAAHLDEVSGGRAILGIGRGSMYHLVGEDPADPVGRVREAILLIRHLLTGASGGFHGRHYVLADGPGLSQRPLQSAVPIFVGTFGPKLCEVAGAVADGVRAAAQWDPRYLPVIRRHVEIGARRAGRDPASVPVVAENWLCLATGATEARVMAPALLAPFLPHLGPMLQFHGIDGLLVDRVRQAVGTGDVAAAARLIPSEVVDLFMAVGGPDDVAAGISRLRDAGIDHVSFSGVLGPDPEVALRLLGEEVLPQFASEARA